MIENLLADVSLIVPEVIVSVTLLLIVLFDLIFNKDKSLIPYIGVVGIFLALYFAIQNIGVNTHAFIVSSGNQNYGLLALDSFGSYFRIIILIASILIVFFAKASSEIQQLKERSGEFYALLFGMILG
ncbi:MAG: NADH-quinone oxidoreductase subunit N, partial [Ignavibacteriae bacterium]|nr:NADH-quinone oxidoreductase subunit N [Ignavibacteriota bacterium]